MGAPFDTWANLVRRAVHWATGHDPLATKSEAKSADKAAIQLPALIEGWGQLCASASTEGLTSSQAIKILEDNPHDHTALRTILVELTRDGKLPSPQKLGNYLGGVRGRPHAGRAIGTILIHGINHWTVLQVRSTATKEGSDPKDELPF
jgi:hypothetical protein